MKKIFKILLILLCASFLSACGKDDQKSVLNKINKKVDKVQGYQLKGEMELINNEDSYKYDVTVSYKKENKFRVSLRNKVNNHEQIILKNDDGVYVLTPTLNKSFKFQSKWPYNNSQAYLLQSVIKDMLDDKNLSMKKDNNKYIFTSDVNYKNNVNLEKQEIIFDKDLIIKSVVVYDKDNNPQIKVKFNEVDMNAKFKDDYFLLEKNMDVSKTNQTISQNEELLQEAIYPMYLPEGTYLESEKVVDLDEGSRIILTFSGTDPFMLVEQTAVKEDDMAVIPTSGDLDMIADSVAIIGESSISWVSQNVEYYLVSSDLTKEELVNVAKSISVLPVNK